LRNLLISLNNSKLTILTQTNSTSQLVSSMVCARIYVLLF
jgi:hypothetical protein